MMLTYLMALVVGLCVGVLSGLLGIGGGVMMVPAFRVLFGLNALVSTATSLFTIIPTTASGIIAHLRAKTCIPKLGILLGVSGALFSPVGVWLAQISPSLLIISATALGILYSAFTMFKKAFASPKEISSNPGEISYRLAPVFILGAGAGLFSGYSGLGGAFVMVPFLVAGLNLPMRFVSGTVLIAVLILVLPASIMQCLLGNVAYSVGAIVALASVPGAIIGTWLTKVIPERMLRICFGVFLCIASVVLLGMEGGLF